MGDALEYIPNIYDGGKAKLLPVGLEFIKYHGWSAVSCAYASCYWRWFHESSVRLQ